MKTHIRNLFTCLGVTSTRSRVLPALTAGLGLMLATSAPAQTFTVLHTFTASSTNSVGVYTNKDGANPLAGLILLGNILYGTAATGGNSGNGTVFAVSTDSTGFTNLHSFTATSYLTSDTNSDGADPQSALISSDNMLYGTAATGGSSASGTVFAVKPDGTGFTNLYSFTDGGFPKDGLILSNNTFYGTANDGGTNGQGMVFAVNINGTGFANLHTFAALDRTYITNSDGTEPAGGLVISGTTVYGTTSFGGANGNGTVFAVNTDGTGFTNLHTFTETPVAPWNNSDGANPSSGLVLSGNTLYGTAYDGGKAGNGTIFAINTDGTGFTNLYNFSAGIGSIPTVTNGDGAFPNAGLIISGDTLYGAATGGGTNSTGTVFALNTNGTGFTTLYSFSGVSGSTAYPSSGTNSGGDGPWGTLILSGDTLYGTADAGGSAGAGTVFSLTLPRPQLTMAVSGANVILSWPTNYQGWYLQTNVNLGAAGFVRITVPGPPVITNGQFVVTLPITNPQQLYYRLSSQ